MQIDPAALAASIGELHDLDLERGLPVILQQVVLAAKTLCRAGGAGIMLADADGELRWASATDQQVQLVQGDQARLGRGPCHAAFSQRMIVSVQNASSEPDPNGAHAVLGNAGFQAVIAVPIRLHGEPIGSLALHWARPRNWDGSEIDALQAYAGIVGQPAGQRTAPQNGS
jgi:GAF domain-containing protein